MEENISLGLRARLAGARTLGEGPPRVAVAGRHSAELAAALRAARALGAAAVPLDARGCDADELMELLAEAQVQIAVCAGAREKEEATIKEAARRLCAPAASARTLHGEGQLCSERLAAEADISGDAPPLILFSTSSDTRVARAAEVPQRAVSARVAAAIRLWGFTEGDVVLSLGLAADGNSAVVDAVEAPLEAGAKVAIAELGHSPEGEVWDLWAALRAQEDATVLFLSSDWCWKLLEARSQLASPVRAELDARWGERPLRHTVAIAPRGSRLSKELSKRWAEAFGSPLTWHFSCAEAGSLLTVASSPEGPEVWSHEGRCAEDLHWRVEDEELWVKGEGLFERYCGRPWSTEQALHAEDGFFRTFLRVAPCLSTQGLLPLPERRDAELEKLLQATLKEGPQPLGGPCMNPDWRFRKVPMRIYDTWRTPWGGLDVTKKHCTVHKVYKAKYKKKRKV